MVTDVAICFAQVVAAEINSKYGDETGKEKNLQEAREAVDREGAEEKKGRRFGFRKPGETPLKRTQRWANSFCISVSLGASPFHPLESSKWWSRPPQNSF